jgi:hypothetical protein
VEAFARELSRKRYDDSALMHWQAEEFTRAEISTTAECRWIPVPI